MKVNPQIRADLGEYPELRQLYETALVNVVRLMQIHDIVDLRRVHKTGVFERAYDRDIVIPLNAPGVPQTVASMRAVAGKALLDYLETIGVAGLSLDLEQSDAEQITHLWTQDRSQPKTEAVIPCAGDKCSKPHTAKKPVQAQKRDAGENQKEKEHEQKGENNGQAKN